MSSKIPTNYTHLHPVQTGIINPTISFSLPARMRKTFFRSVAFVWAFLLTMNTGWGQTRLTEGFEESTTSATTGGTGMPTAYSTGNYILSSGTWDFSTGTNGVIRATGNYNGGSAGCQLKSVTGTYITSPTLVTGGVGTISFYAASTSAGGAVNVSYSINGGAFSAGTSFTSLTTTATLKTVTINDASDNIRVKFSRTAGTLVLDDINITTAEPTTQASSITFSSVATNSMTVGWTIGNGGRRAVFMKAGSGSITNPSDGTSYTASADWNSKGTQLGSSGYYCIYNGTGSSVSLTNLASGTAYYFQVFEYNSDNNSTPTASTINYLITTGTNNPNNQTTATPTLNAVTLGSALSNTYGTASSGVSFTASGSNLTSNITATAQTGYQVSTDNITFGSSVSVSSGTTVYVRFAATMGAGAYNSATAVVLSGGGAASSANVSTSASGNAVSKKALSVTSPSIASKTYDGTTTAGAVTVGTLSGFVGTETVTATGAAAAYSSANVGTYNSVVITYTLADGTNGGLAANYSLANGSATGQITAKALSVTSPSIASKTYDGTTTAGAVTVGTLSGLVGSQTVTATGAAAAYSSANVGTYNSVVITYTLANGTNGGLAANYSLSNGSASGQITAKALSITSPSIASKTYDGTTIAGALTVGNLSGFVGSETVTATGAAAAYSSANAGTYNSVVITYTLANGTNGGLATNYSLSAGSATGVITKATPTINTPPTASDITSGQTLSYSALTNGSASVAGSFAWTSPSTVPALGTTSQSITFTPTDGTNYNTVTANINITANAAASPIIVVSGTLSALSTTYGTASSTTTFTVSGTALTNDITITPPAGFEVSTSSGSGYTTSLNLTQSGGSVASTTIYVRLAATTAAGSYSGNISLTSTDATSQNVATLSSTVSTKALTITGISISNKTYDRTTTATITGSAAYSGLVNGESFSVTGAPSASFGDKTVANGKSVAVSGYTAPSGNYSITQPTGLTANITPATLTVTSASVTSKTYDRTTNATITGSLSGIISGDVVTLSGTGTFASANVGTGIIVTSTSTLAGTDAGNYSLTQPTGLTGNITAAGLTITGLTGANKTYDGTTTATTAGTAALSGVLAGDVGNVTLGGSPVRNFVDANVGNTKTITITGYSISGSASGNYSLSQPTGLTGNITALGLTISGLTGVNKVYDKTTTATTTGTAALSGVLAGDVGNVTLGGTASASFADANVGNAKAITITGYSISGSASGNYSLSTPSGVTANITAVGLTITGLTGANKVYDGTTAATTTGTAALSGVLAGDVSNVTLSGTPVRNFADANVGSAKAITITGYSISGSASANYSLSQPTGLTANITQASQTITFATLPAKTTADAAFACGATSATSGTNALTYSSSNTSVATISVSGVITIVGAGTTTITVSQAGSANYAAATDVAQIWTVTQGPCGTENFSNITNDPGTTSSYLSRSWTGTNGTTWLAQGARTDRTISGPAICFGTSGTRSVTSSTYSNGIGTLTFDYVRDFTGTNGRTIQVWINGSQIGSDISVSSTSDVVQNYSQTINISGNVVVEIRSTNSSTSSNQIKIDNISWTCYTASPVAQAVSTSAASSIVNTTATLNGNLTTVGVSPNTTEKGFVYAATATNGTPQVGGTGVTKTSVAGISTGAYTLSLAGLSTNTGYSFRAYAYDGTNYTYGSVLTFTTLTVATKLGFGTTPPAVGSISTNLTTFTVQALRSDNTLDTEFSGSITVAKASGPGNIAGTLTANASAGVATFSSVQFDALGDYTIISSSGALTTVTSSTISILAFAVGDYRTRASGDWGAYTSWEKWNGSAWNACSSADVPDVSTASVTIRSGHIIDNDGTTGYPWDVNNLTVESGGKVWDNQFGGINTYIQIYGDIICNGTIGDPNGDDISFDIAGGNDCSISGTGSFTATRIRKDADINSNTDASLSFDMDVRLTWSSNSGTVLYNDAGTAVLGNQASQFNITVTSGKTVRCSGPGAVTSGVSIDGLYGGSGSSDNTGGVYTIYGTLDMDGAFYSSNNNSSNNTSLIIKNGGTVKCRYVETGSSGASGNTLRIESGGKLNIFGSVDTITATLNDITWNGYSTTNNTWDFQSGSTIEYSGATQQRVNGITSCSNFTASGGGLKKLGNDFTVAGMLTLTGGRVQTDAYKLIHSSTVASDLTHTSGNLSFIYGTYRRYIASNSSTYELPVGLSSSTTGYRRLDLINNSLSGVTYIDASVRLISETGNNLDSRLSTTQNGSALTDVIGTSVWSLIPNAQPSGGTYGVKLFVANSGLSDSDDNTFCAVKRNDNSTDYADWNTFYASTTIPASGAPGRMFDAGNGYAQRLGYTSFSEHAIGKTPTFQPLPIELNQFEAFCLEKGKTSVHWSTASEHNTSYFQLDRSNNGMDWQALGVVGAAVNSSEQIQYNFEDRNDGGVLYYRLHQVDINGGEQMYGPISVSCELQDIQIHTFPNPSNGSFNVSLYQPNENINCMVQVLDSKGTTIYSVNESFKNGMNLIEINDSDWLRGVYFIQVQLSDGRIYRVKHTVI